MKKFWNVFRWVLTALLAVVVIYVAYVLLSYHRIGDAELEISGAGQGEVQTGQTYTLTAYNIGFGAYESDFGFFMDGGTESWAWSEERLNENLAHIAAFLAEQDSDFYLLQEVDRDSTRSYHVDQVAAIVPSLGQASYTWAQNYDSPFLFYPFTQPHGASVSGLVTASRFPITSAKRVELPIEESLMKLIDLDRCYSVQRFAVEGGKELVLYNLHLSAYTSDGTIANEQLDLLLSDMEAEYQAGNYCVAGGDFNKDLLGDSEAYFGASEQEYTWAQPIPAGVLDQYHMTLVAPLTEDDPVPSCRNADGPYHAGQYVLTVDGFLVSPNVAPVSSAVVDLGFAYSDHNPVELQFDLT